MSGAFPLWTEPDDDAPDAWRGDEHPAEPDDTEWDAEAMGGPEWKLYRKQQERDEEGE